MSINAASRTAARKFQVRLAQVAAAPSKRWPMRSSRQKAGGKLNAMSSKCGLTLKGWRPLAALTRRLSTNNRKNSGRPVGLRPARLKIACARWIGLRSAPAAGRNWKPPARAKDRLNRFTSRFPITLARLTSGRFARPRHKPGQNPCQRRQLDCARTAQLARSIAPTRRHRAIFSRVNPRWPGLRAGRRLYSGCPASVQCFR